MRACGKAAATDNVPDLPNFTADIGACSGSPSSEDLCGGPFSHAAYTDLPSNRVNDAILFLRDNMLIGDAFLMLVKLVDSPDANIYNGMLYRLKRMAIEMVAMRTHGDGKLGAWSWKQHASISDWPTPVNYIGSTEICMNIDKGLAYEEEDAQTTLVDLWMTQHGIAMGELTTVTLGVLRGIVRCMLEESGMVQRGDVGVSDYMDKLICALECRRRLRELGCETRLRLVTGVSLKMTSPLVLNIDFTTTRPAHQTTSVWLGPRGLPDSSSGCNHVLAAGCAGYTTEAVEFIQDLLIDRAGFSAWSKLYSREAFQLRPCVFRAPDGSVANAGVLEQAQIDTDVENACAKLLDVNMTFICPNRDTPGQSTALLRIKSQVTGRKYGPLCVDVPTARAPWLVYSVIAKVFDRYAGDVSVVAPGGSGKQ